MVEYLVLFGELCAEVYGMFLPPYTTWGICMKRSNMISRDESIADSSLERYVGYDWYEYCLGNLDGWTVVYDHQGGEEEGH